MTPSVPLPAAATAADRHILLWRRAGKQTSTWWLQGQGNAWEIVGERAGLWTAGRGDVFGWRVVKRRIAVCDAADCAQEDGACRPVMVKSGPFEGIVEDGQWVGLLSGAAHPIGDRLPDKTAVALGSPGFLRRIEPVAQLGELLLVQVVTETWSCGSMHGRTAVDFRRLLAPDGVLLPMPTPDPAVIEADGVAAGAALDSAHPKATGALQWQTVHLRATATGEWRIDHEFAREEATEFGHAVWRSWQVPATVLPAFVDQALEAAPNLASAVAALPAVDPRGADDVHYGWSEIRGGATATEAQQQRFLCNKAAP